MGTTEQELSLHSLNILLDGFLFNLSPNCEIMNYYLSGNLKLADNMHKYTQMPAGAFLQNNKPNIIIRGKDTDWAISTASKMRL